MDLTWGDDEEVLETRPRQALFVYAMMWVMLAMMLAVCVLSLLVLPHGLSHSRLFPSPGLMSGAFVIAVGIGRRPLRVFAQAKDELARELAGDTYRWAFWSFAAILLAFGVLAYGAALAEAIVPQTPASIGTIVLALAGAGLLLPPVIGETLLRQRYRQRQSN